MKIVLVGKSDLQTDLLLSLLRHSITPDCSLQGCEQPPTTVTTDSLYILDIAALGSAGVSALLHALNPRGLDRAALINVDDAHDQSQLAALPGVRGLFPKQVSTEQFLRGIQAIVDGDYWLPRHVLCTHLEKTRQLRPAASSASTVKLSPKERQLLALLSQGCSNDVIASRLAISPHTVKTHFYNLYRKLQVRNRVQAATWAQSHSSELEAAL
jgi:LuxR family transcriptional regulator of csgAB operon